MTIELIGPTFKPQDKIIESMCVFFMDGEVMEMT